MRVIIYIFLIINTLTIIGCTSVSNRIETFVTSIKSNPELIKSIVTSNDIILHDSLLIDIKKQNIDLEKLSNEIKNFYDNNNLISLTKITDKKAFYIHLWRKDIDIGSFDYYHYIYCQDAIKQCLSYEFLIDKHKNIILFEIQIGRLR